MKEPDPNDVELRVKFSIDESLMYEASLAFARSRRLGRPAQILLAVAGPSLAAILLIRPTLLSILGAAIWLLGCAYFIWKIPRGVARETTRKGRDVPGLLGDHELEISAGAVVESTSVNRSVFALHAIDRIERYDDFILIHITPMTYLPVPRDAIFCGETFETFAERLLAMWHRARNLDQNEIIAAAH